MPQTYEEQVTDFIARMAERGQMDDSALEIYAGQMLDPVTKKPVISANELKQIYLYFNNPDKGKLNELYGLTPGEPTGMVFSYKDMNDPELTRTAEIVMTPKGLELIIRTGNKLAGFSEDPELKQEPGATAEGAKKARRFAVQVDDVVPRAKARLQIELTGAFEGITYEVQQYMQHALSKWLAIVNEQRSQGQNMRNYFYKNPDKTAEDEYEYIGKLINITKEYYAEAKVIAGIDPQATCKYIDHPALGSIYVHGDTSRKEAISMVANYDVGPTFAINMYSDLAMCDLNLINLSETLITFDDKRAEFSDKFQGADKEFLDNCEYAGDILKGLEFMHSNGVVHLDIKPANFLLDRDENRKLYVKLADFGTATLLTDKRALERNTSGTPAFWSREDPNNPRDPFEIVKGTPDDMWAAGISLYMLLTGDYPSFKEYIPIDRPKAPNPNEFTNKENALFNARKLYQIEVDEYNEPFKSARAEYTKQVLAANPLLAGLLNLNPEKRLNATAALDVWNKQRCKLVFVPNTTPAPVPHQASTVPPQVAKNQTVAAPATSVAPPVIFETPRRKSMIRRLSLSRRPKEALPFDENQVEDLLSKIQGFHATYDGVLTQDSSIGVRGNTTLSNTKEQAEAINEAEKAYIIAAKSSFAALGKIYSDHKGNLKDDDRKAIETYQDEFRDLQTKHKPRFGCF